MNAIIVDDEFLAIEYLERILKDFNNIKVVGSFTYFNINDNKDLLKEIDIVFLDIEMPELNGLELAEKILEINSSLAIVFVTAFNEYAIQAFELNALDYILKPVQKERLENTLHRIKTSNSEQRIEPLHTKTLRVNLSEELSFEWPDDTRELIQWRTTKAQELFLYLLHNQGKVILKSDLAQLLWPDFDQERAFSQLYTAIYHIRKVIGNYGRHFSIKNMQDSYVLLTTNIIIDVVEWENRLRDLASVGIDNAQEFEEIMESFKGKYLHNYNYLWAEAEQFRLGHFWLKVAYKLAKFYEDHNLEQAENWYREICEKWPEEENAHFALMKIYSKYGYGMLVDHQYGKLKEGLATLGLEINPTVTEWYNQWKSNS